MKSTLAFQFHVLLFVFVLASAGAKAQQNGDLIMGDRFFDKFEYADALYYYDLVYDQLPNDPSITRRIADTYRRMGQLAMSAEYYRKTLEMDVSQPEDMLHYGEALKCLQEYDEAIEWFGRYNAAVPNDRRVQSHLKDPMYYQDLFADSLKYILRKLAINSSDPAIGVSRFEKGQYFISSMRLETPTPEEKKKWEKELPYLDVYLCDLSENDDLIHPKKLDENVNSKYHDGPVYFCERDHTLYITRNNIRNGKPVRDKKGNVNLKIYSSTYENGEWETAAELKFNQDNFSNGHPCLTKDGNFMYFVSNQDGGFGGTDIYLSQRVGETWTEPINLGQNINSEGDEMFPFIASNGALYFASNGWAGLGGLDIFRSDLSAGKWAAPVNLGYPINTSQDDFGILYNNADDSGFFCSNRDGNGNDDVFFFNTINLMKMVLAGVIHSPEPNKSLAGQKILIRSTLTGEVYESNLNAKEEFSFEASPGDRIEVTLAAEEYSNLGSVISYEVPNQLKDPFANIGTYYATPGKLDSKNAGFNNDPNKSAVLNKQNLPGGNKSTTNGVNMDSPASLNATTLQGGDSGNDSGVDNKSTNGNTSPGAGNNTAQSASGNLNDPASTGNSTANHDMNGGQNPSGKSSDGSNSMNGQPVSGNPTSANGAIPATSGNDSAINKAAVAQGVIVDAATQEGLPFATITYTGPDGTLQTVMTDEKGRFTIGGDVPSKINIRIDKLEYLSCNAEVNLTDKQVKVTPMKVKMEKPFVPTMVEVTGIVNGENNLPLTGVKVTCTNVDGTKVLAVTDSKGRYTLKTFEQKGAVISFEKEEYSIDSQTLDIVTANASGSRNKQKTASGLSKTTDVSVVVSGTVLNGETSLPMKDVTVTCKNSDGTGTVAITDAEGYYSMKTFQQYDAFFTFEKDGFLLGTKTEDVTNESFAGVIMDISLQKSTGNTVNMSGTLTDPDTQMPVGNATVIFRGEDGSVTEVTADQLGRYSLNVNANLKGKLTVEKDGYEIKSTDVDTGTTEQGGLRLDISLRKAAAHATSSTSSSKQISRKAEYEHVVDLTALSIDNVLFDYDKAYIREDSKPILDQVKVLMEQFPSSVLIISTHSDSRGSIAYNQQLSMSRGMSIKGYLLKKGIDPSRMRVEYFGETKPLNGCTDDVPCNEQEYEVNRRAEFMLVTEVSANKK